MTSHHSLRHLVLSAATCIFAVNISLPAQQETAAPLFHTDTDHDGLSDLLENTLLQQFAPHFMVGQQDCSVRPAEFLPGLATPEIAHENGTIYGQVFPARSATDRTLLAEIHYYHLWRRDCGGHGHPLDTEHVAVLVRASGTHPASATWKAVYWYAAAHESTVCDVSQIARASTLHAEDHGAMVWISPGKHASYLNETLCARGCGADRCEKMIPLAASAVINLGEPGAPMNGSLFTASPRWPLQAKMTASNFPDAPINRLNQLPLTDIAWFNPGRHPAQGIIAHSSTTEQALANSSRNTTSAISVAGGATGDALTTSGSSTTGALSTAGSSTSNALSKASHRTIHALGSSAQGVGKALHVTPQKPPPESEPDPQ